MDTEYVYLNDQLVDAQAAAVPITDSAFLYGIGLFETMRAVNGSVFRLNDHLERLNKSAAALGVNNRYDAAAIETAIGRLMQANELTDARIRLSLSNGPIAEDGKPACTLLITAAPFTPYPKEHYEKGVRVILTDYRQNPKDPAAGHKTACYAPRLMALRDAHAKLAAEALWFTTENTLAEGCISNVFIVRDGALCTPPLHTPVLPGVARKTVLELAEKLGLNPSEKTLRIDDLLAAEEVFLTNVIMQVLPVVGIEAHTVGDGKPGKITRQVLEAYTQRLGL